MGQVRFFLKLFFLFWPSKKPARPSWQMAGRDGLGGWGGRVGRLNTGPGLP